MTVMTNRNWAFQSSKHLSLLSPFSEMEPIKCIEFNAACPFKVNGMDSGSGRQESLPKLCFSIKGSWHLGRVMTELH